MTSLIQISNELRIFSLLKIIKLIITSKRNSLRIVLSAKRNL